MNYPLLQQVVGELTRVLPAAKTEKIIPLGKGGLCFRFRSAKRFYHLLLSPDRSRPRIHLMSHRPAAAEHPGTFYLQVRKYFQGARLEGIAISGNDRIVEMNFGRSDAWSILIFELFGSKANLILTDAQHKMEAVLYPTTPDAASGRVLLPGMVYEAPVPRMHPAESGLPQGLRLPESTDETDVGINLAVEAWFETALQEQETASLRRRLVRIIERELGRAERRIGAIQSDLQTADKSDEFRRYGEILLAKMGNLDLGQGHCTVTDFDGNEISISLDPQLSVAENADRYFKKYKKGKAGSALLRERLDAARADTEFYHSVQRELQTSGTDDLERINRVLRARGMLPGKDRSAVRNGRTTSVPYRVVRIAGWDVLIGKSAAGNDYITMNLAKPDDLWLHAEGIPGSHVLVRNPGKRDVPQEILRKAASFAAYHSKAKNAGRVAIAYTDAKYVRKPKGAKPGMVVLAQRKTIMAVPEST